MFENMIMKWRESKMKKLIALLMASVLALSLAACSNSGNNNSQAPENNSQTPASQPADNSTAPSDEGTNSGAPVSQSADQEISGTVNTNGSTSMDEVMGFLKEAFEELHDGVTIQYTGSGSGAGITGAQEGTCDIGLASRDLKDSETGVKQVTVAKDGIAIIVNPANPVADLSIEQIAALATGEITNWSEVGGNDAQVVFMGREAGSGTRDGFESITGTEDLCKYQNEYTSTGEVVAGVAANPNAIGYASLSAVTGDNTVKVLTVGGVAPSEETVLDGTYTIQRNFNFIVSDSKELSPAAQAFIDWATSADASQLIKDAGAVPLV